MAQRRQNLEGTMAEATSTATHTEPVPFLQEYIKVVNQHLCSTMEELQHVCQRIFLIHLSTMEGAQNTK